MICFNLTQLKCIDFHHQCNGCIKTCNSDELECYVIDNNAYIVLARNVNHTGKFFGEYQGDVMEAMVQLEYFQSIDVYDYQSLCVDEDAKLSDGNDLLHVSRAAYLKNYVFAKAKSFFPFFSISKPKALEDCDFGLEVVGFHLILAIFTHNLVGGWSTL